MTAPQIPMIAESSGPQSRHPVPDPAAIAKLGSTLPAQIPGMDSVDLQVLKKAAEWLRDGQRVTLGTVVRTWGSAPRPVGSLVAIRGDGQIVGSVSGGCIEDDLVERVRAEALATERPERARYGVTADEAFRFGLPCGGTIELILEPLTKESRIDALLERTS